MRKSLLLALLVTNFCYSSRAQGSYKFKQATLSDNVTKKNIVTGDLSIGGFGLGFCIGVDYEGIIGASGMFSFILPLYYVSSGDHFMEVASVGDCFHNQHALVLAPGIRYHPFGAFNKVDMGIAAQLAMGPLSVREDVIYAAGSELNNYYSMLLAPLAQINVTFGSKTVFGLFLAGGSVIAGDFGFGIDNKKLEAGFFQLGIKLGGRF